MLHSVTICCSIIDTCIYRTSSTKYGESEKEEEERQEKERQEEERQKEEQEKGSRKGT